MIDDNINRVACNPKSNIIICSPFYVYKLHKQGDDSNYLQSTLWPLLQALYIGEDIEEFHNCMVVESDGCEPHEGTMEPHGPYCK